MPSGGVRAPEGTVPFPATAGGERQWLTRRAGPGIAIGYDDLKVTEANKFLVAVTGGERRNCSVDDALATAEVLSAAERSAGDGTSG